MANQSQDSGLYLPSTYIYDIQNLSNIELPEDLRELLIRLYQSINDITEAINLKNTGYYVTTEFNTGQLLFNANNDFSQLRNIYRTTINFGALPAAGTKSVAHGITGISSTYTGVKLYGVATNPATPQFIPIPYSSASAVASNLELTLDATNVNITTGGTDYSAYTRTLVVIELVKFV